MATEESRTFDMAHGAVVISVKDRYENVSSHTLYVAGVPDVNAAVQSLLAQVDDDAAMVRERMVAAGWKE